VIRFRGLTGGARRGPVRWLLGAFLLMPTLASVAAEERVEQLVFGSFADPANAQAYALRGSAELAQRLQPDSGHNGLPLALVAQTSATPILHRVVTNPAAAVSAAQLRVAASAAKLDFWQHSIARVAPPAEPPAASQPLASQPLASQPPPAQPPPAQPVPSSVAAAPQSAKGPELNEPAALEPTRSRRREAPWRVETDVALQNRLFARGSLNNGDLSQQSIAATLDVSKDWNGGVDSVQLSAFGRLDSDDSRRTHADLRQFSYIHAANNWQLEVGIGQVFWGVVEFNHLIDVVNQTDLVENVDIEDNLGQPLVGLTLLQDWGTLEIYALPGFRERTFASLDGRLTAALPIDRSATRYESGAEDSRIDGLVRYSHQLGAADFGIYYFNGNRRTPRFEVGFQGDDPVLIPVYDTVRQTGLDLQLNSGDTAYKLEALHSVGGPEEYFAFAAGVEHTFVGVFGGRSDWGLVAEYHWDERGEAAFDSVFERDIALGARWLSNDLVDTQALIGVIWDTRNSEYLLSVEASRRLGEHWNVALEARGFGGASAIGQSTPLAAIADPNNTLGALVRDDYLQLEFVRFF